MKAAIAILIVIAFSTVVNAQQKTDNQEEQQINLQLDRAGQKIQQGGNLMMAAAAVGLLGTGATAVGALLETQELMIGGVVVAAVSIPLSMGGAGSLINGGKILREKPKGSSESRMSETDLEALRRANQEALKRDKKNK